MKQAIKKLTALIDVKTIVTLIVMVVFAVLALTGKISPDNVMIITSTVVAFYFGTQHQKKVADVTEEAAIPADKTGEE